MNTLVIYDSIFGNTEKIAQAIGTALGCTVRKVNAVQPADLNGIKLLIVGSPTRAFGATPAMKSFLSGLPAGSLTGVRTAVFDTRYTVKTKAKMPPILKTMAGIFGYAAEKMAKTLVKKGATMVGEPGWFSVDNSEGPLSAGELERAAAWAGQLRK
jgi:flavodoxin I